MGVHSGTLGRVDIWSYQGLREYNARHEIVPSGLECTRNHWIGRVARVTHRRQLLFVPDVGVHDLSSASKPANKLFNLCCVLDAVSPFA
jgi:hypothetical protein